MRNKLGSFLRKYGVLMVGAGVISALVYNYVRKSSEVSQLAHPLTREQMRDVAEFRPIFGSSQVVSSFPIDKVREWGRDDVGLRQAVVLTRKGVQKDAMVKFLQRGFVGGRLSYGPEGARQGMDVYVVLASADCIAFNRHFVVNCE